MKLIIENGPILRHVTELHFASGLLMISFVTPHAATIAHLATGWPFHGDRALEITAAEASIILHPLNDLAREPTQHESWTLTEDDAYPSVTASTPDLVRRAVAGFFRCLCHVRPPPRLFRLRAALPRAS